MSDQEKLEYTEFLDKLINKCTDNLAEQRMISKLHKEQLDSLQENHSQESLSDFTEMTTRQELHSLITSCLLDLAVIIRLYQRAQLLWEKIFLIRKAYMTVYEGLKAFDKHKQKIRLLIQISSFPGLEFDVINNSIKQFKKTYKYDQVISKIRNKTAGHFDSDFDTYFDTINQIDPTSGINAAQELMKVMADIDSFLSLLRHHLNSKVKLKGDLLKGQFEQEVSSLKMKLELEIKKMQEKIKKNG
jgi:hypothetical protein